VIYEFPGTDEPIRQGDIFHGLPYVEISLENLKVLSAEEDLREVAWSKLVEEGQNISAICGVRAVRAIVVTQDCDALRAPDITLCEVRPFREVERQSKETKSSSSWVRMITQHCKKNLKWFYLPPDEQIGFSEKMGVDFQATLRLDGDELRSNRHLRRGRLNNEADEHFRERLAEFFRRYPYDEWYPLSRDEFTEYRREYAEAEPRAWQKPNEPATP